MPAKAPCRQIIARKGSLSAPWCAAKMNDAGQPVQSFAKDLIYVGQFVKASTGQDLSVTSADLDHWSETFAAMKAAGVKVPVNLDHSGYAEHQRGWITDMYRQGDTLWGVVELVGQDAIDMAGRTEVSIGITDELIDGTGKKYERAIEHVALTAYPVVPDQGGFIKLSGRDGTKTKAAVYTEPKNMNHLHELARLLGCDPEKMKDEEMFDACKARISSLNAANTLNASLKSENDRLKADAGKKPEAPSNLTLRLLGENRKLKIDAARSAGIGKEFCDAIEGIVIGGTERTALSRTADEQSDGIIAAFLEAIGKLPPVRQPGHAGGVHATRQTPQDKPEDDKADPKVAESMLARSRELRGVQTNK